MNDDTLISHTNLDRRALRRLTEMGLRTVGEVRRTPDFVLLRQRSLGKTTLRQIREVLGGFINAEPLPANPAEIPALDIDAEWSSKLRSIAAQLIEIADLIQSRQQGGVR